MIKNFRTYNLALEFYRTSHTRGGLKDSLPTVETRDQFHRAALSVVLNLSEGSAKPTEKDRKKFYAIAFASFREVQTLVQISGIQELDSMADKLAAHLYKLCRSS